MVDVPLPPPDPRGQDWRTVTPLRRVLLIADNATAMTRLLDLVDLFDGDLRVQCCFVWNSEDPFPDGLHRMFAAAGIVPLPREAVRSRDFDLAITAGHSGLSKLRTPLLSVPHGIRYTKSVSRLDLDRCSGQDHRLWLMRCHSGWFPTSS
ncbi:hypothetical protein ACFQ16_30500, partial [Saccharopolyspora rosea]